MSKKDTQSVAVQLSLKSSLTTSPFNITECDSTITDVDGKSLHYSGWNPQNVGKPQAGGADFTLTVQDLDYATTNQTTLANWVLTCLRRGATREASPFSANDSSIAGNGGTLTSSGIFTLDLKNAKIKNAGSWDWSLLVQIVMPDQTVKCFVSDPEMDVQAILLT
jgi:hypothetical protein